MPRYIDADALIDRSISVLCGGGNEEMAVLVEDIDSAPTIDAVGVVRGEWKEREKFHNADDNPIIEEWQSARCSVCGKYHTTPYMYYFDEYNFCPNCGAKMSKESE